MVLDLESVTLLNSLAQGLHLHAEPQCLFDLELIFLDHVGIPKESGTGQAAGRPESEGIAYIFTLLSSLMWLAFRTTCHCARAP